MNKKETLDNASLNRNRSRNNSAKSKRSIANTTIIVDEEGNEVIQEDNVDISNGRMLSVDSDGGDEEELRRYNFTAQKIIILIKHLFEKYITISYYHSIPYQVLNRLRILVARQFQGKQWQQSLCRI